MYAKFFLVSFAGLWAVMCGLARGDDQSPASKSDAKSAMKPENSAASPSMTAENAASPLDFTMKDIDGKDVPLSTYKGDVLLIVNVASDCGLTPQYKELQALHEKYKSRGLRILGFPANNFKEQEPGTNEAIKEFCTTKYGVTFPMFAKIPVKGDDTHELYKYLTSEPKVGRERAGEIKWNFTKFLVGRDGRVSERFEPKTKPDETAVIEALEKALAASKPGK